MGEFGEFRWYDYRQPYTQHTTNVSIQSKEVVFHEHTHSAVAENENDGNENGKKSTNSGRNSMQNFFQFFAVDAFHLLLTFTSNSNRKRFKSFSITDTDPEKCKNCRRCFASRRKNTIAPSDKNTTIEQRQQRRRQIFRVRFSLFAYWMQRRQNDGAAKEK